MNTRSRSAQHQTQGFTLIEAMVAAALLGLGLLGATTLTLHNLNATASSRQQDTALTLAQNAIDCFRSGPDLCTASATWVSTGRMLEAQTLDGTAYEVRSQTSPTSIPRLQELQVTVDWHPAGNSPSTNNPMAPGSGQLALSTRLASVPFFVSASAP